MREHLLAICAARLQWVQLFYCTLCLFWRGIAGTSYRRTMFIRTVISDLMDLSLRRERKSEWSRPCWLKLLSTHASEGVTEWMATATLASNGMWIAISCQYSRGWGSAWGMQTGPLRDTHWPNCPRRAGNTSPVCPSLASRGHNRTPSWPTLCSGPLRTTKKGQPSDGTPWPGRTGHR